MEVAFWVDLYFLILHTLVGVCRGLLGEEEGVGEVKGGYINDTSQWEQWMPYREAYPWDLPKCEGNVQGEWKY